MKTASRLFGMFTLGMLLFACNSESTQKQDVVSAPEAVPPATSERKPELFVYVVQYDNLRLRDQPGQSSSVTSKLRQGELVSGTGVQSSQEETIELRDIPMKSPYFKVRTIEAKEGWIFGAAVQMLYAGTEVGKPNLEKLQSLSTFLQSLDPKKIENGAKAWDYVRKMPAENNTTLAEGTFILIEDFLRRMEFEGDIYRLTEKITWENDDFTAVYENRFDVNKYPVTKKLADSGFRLLTAEGSIFPTKDWKVLQQYFAPRVGSGMKAYIEQSVFEQQMSAMDDGGILISLEELADRAVFWEKFNRSNPWFPYKMGIEESQRWLTNALVMGTENTPVFDYESKQVLPEYRKMWEYVQKKYPGTNVASRVKAFADLCASEGWKRTPKVDELMGKMVM